MRIWLSRIHVVAGPTAYFWLLGHFMALPTRLQMSQAMESLRQHAYIVYSASQPCRGWDLAIHYKMEHIPLGARRVTMNRVRRASCGHSLGIVSNQPFS